MMIGEVLSSSGKSSSGMSSKLGERTSVAVGLAAALNWGGDGLLSLSLCHWSSCHL